MTSSKIANTSHSKLVASQVLDIRMSAIKEMAMLSAKIEDAASLAWGLPSFKTPEYIRQGVIHDLLNDDDIGKYALPDGLVELRQLVSKKHLAETGIETDPDENIMITSGNMQGTSNLLDVITNPGDEIILTDPCFSSHIQQIKLSGGKPVYWPLDEKNEWRLNVDILPDLISKKTKALIIVSPSNPTGKIFSEINLMRIGALAKQHGFLIIIDDPYSLFTYENEKKFFNLASVKEFFDNTVYLYTFSKAYAMSGWRLGYMVLPAQLKKQVLKVHDLNIICTARVSQIAGIHALSGEPEHFIEFKNRLTKRRELMCQRLDAIPHVFDYIKPEGAYYIFPRILTTHKNAYDFCMDLLYKAKVTLTPGSAFGPSGEHHARMAYCVSDDTINIAFDRIEKYFGSS